MTGQDNNGASEGNYFCEVERSGPSGPGQIVVVFQGGGALGSYQAGVYQAIHEAGIEPDWIVGTSIGAINASLIAGNAPEQRLPALREFWRRVESRSFWSDLSVWPGLAQSLACLSIMQNGIPAFFEPNPAAMLGPHMPINADDAGYYSTAPLERTLIELVDFGLVQRSPLRLTVGAAHVCSSRMHYFDSRDQELGVKHILASGALPPAFPPVRINGELYWDGGILSNTPTEVVFDDNPRRDSLIFSVHVWNADGPEPQTMWEAAHRLKDVQYSSRIAGHIVRQKQAHRLRHVITELLAHVPATLQVDERVRALAAFGCRTQMHVVRLLTPRHADENHMKDIDFSPEGISRRWEAGYRNAQQAIAAAPWRAEVDPMEGVILHDRDVDGWQSR